jgi:hypothetical protein
MVAMLSRPPSGSLRTTRVTIVTIALATVGFFIVGSVGVVLALGAGSRILPWLAAIVLEVFAVSSGALALFGLLQRRPRSN